MAIQVLQIQDYARKTLVKTVCGAESNDGEGKKGWCDHGENAKVMLGVRSGTCIRTRNLLASQNF